MDYTYCILLGLHLVACSLFAYFDANRDKIQLYITHIYDKYLKYTIESSAISALTCYSAWKNKVCRISVTIYECHPLATHTADLCIYGYKSGCSFYGGYLIEPFCPQWISQNQLITIEYKQPAYPLKNIETYNSLPRIDTPFSAHIFIRSFNMDSFSLSQMQLNQVYSEKLLYARFNDIYVSRVQLSDSITLRSAADFTRPSKVSFLSISVSVNKKKYNVDMEKKWMYVNNDLFSKTFLTRYFDYHNITVKLTNDYVVNLMDNNINMFQLKPGEYIQLSHNDYTIKLP